MLSVITHPMCGTELLSNSMLNHDNSPQNMVHSSVAMGFPGGSNGKESACNVGGMGLTPGQEDALKKEMAPHSSTPCLGDAMDRGAGGHCSCGRRSNYTTTSTVAIKYRPLFHLLNVLEVNVCDKDYFYIIFSP